ncbi:hypothetical protein [Saccharomonospora halophila]|uniref:hypothetical protein n=1 Tax=Saccharomonospora halophila TaxID=129922 RepID=UPI00037E2DCB|nr:hypothetical protein [Saccharomonospora halophila]
MSTFDVLARYGTAVLLRFAGAVVLFLLLHLVRIPLVLAARALETAMRRLDAYTARHTARPPRQPINHYFTQSEGARAHV